MTRQSPRNVLFAAALLAAAPSLAEDATPPAYQNLLTPLLKSGTDVLGAPLTYPAGTPVITSATVTIPPGGETGWHQHEVPLFAYILEGELTVDYGKHGTRTYKKGDSLMEAMNVAHFSVNNGTEPVRLLAVYMGASGAKDVVPVK